MNRAFFKFIAALLIWGTNGIVASFIPLSSYEIVLLRTMLGSIFLIAIYFGSGQKLTAHRHKKQFLYLCIAGVTTGASWLLLYEAYAQIGVSIATLLYYCGPVFVMALSPILFKEKLTAPKLIGFGCVLVGIVLVNGDLVGGGSPAGFFCGVLSAIMFAALIIFNKKIPDITGLENAMLQLVISFLTVAVFVGVKQGFAMPITSSSLLPILILGVLNSAVSSYLYFSSIGRLPLQTVAICGYLEPLSAVVFSVIFLREIMTPAQIVGAVLIVGSAVFVECFTKGKQAHSA